VRIDACQPADTLACFAGLRVQFVAAAGELPMSAKQFKHVLDGYKVLDFTRSLLDPPWGA